jgi:hypothetical protein
MDDLTLIVARPLPLKKRPECPVLSPASRF